MVGDVPVEERTKINAKTDLDSRILDGYNVDRLRWPSFLVVFWCFQ